MKKSGYKWTVFIIIIGLILPSVGNCGWNLWISNYDECMDKYLKETKTNYGVRVASSACTNLYGDKKINREEENRNKCFLDEAINQTSDLAVKYAASRCIDKYKDKKPTPKTAKISITDSCNDNDVINFVFFDVTNNLEWPGDNKVYIAKEHGTEYTNSLQCIDKSIICFGAESSSQTYKWGAGIKNDIKYNINNDCIVCGDNKILRKDLICK